MSKTFSKIVLGILIVLLGMAWPPAFKAIWSWSHDQGLADAKKQFEIESYAIEKRILKEFNLFCSSEVTYYIDTQRFSLDFKKGLVRHFPPGEIEIMLYFPKAQWDAYLAEGGGKLENSPGYQKIRNQVMGYFEERFTDPWLAEHHPSHLKPLFIIKASPGNRSREQFLTQFEKYGKTL